jgi:hypothetical protein
MQNKFFGSKLNTVILVVLVLLVGVFIKKEFYTKEEVRKVDNPNIQISGNKDDLVSFSILPGSKLRGLVSYRGTIKGAYFFEANILINILDANKNLLKASHTMATSDWMTAEGVDFEGKIDLSGLPKGPAYFEIHNDNASGLPEHDKSVLVPIVIE